MRRTRTNSLAGVAPSNIGNHPGSYDSRLCLYNLKPYHFRASRAAAAKARAGVGDLRIAHIGDSTTGGVGATPGVSDWPTHLKNLLVASGIPSNGTGWVAAWKSSAQDSRWTYSQASWLPLNSGSSLIINSSNTNTATFTSDVAGTIAEVYFSANGGPWTVTVDGATVTTGVTITGAGTYSGGTVTPTNNSSVGTLTFSGLANTTHTIVITRVSGNTQIFAAGVRSGTTGLKVYNAGIGGMKSDAITNGQWYEVGSTTSNPAGGWSFQAHLTTLMLQTNDANQGTALPTYRQQLQTAITQIKNNGSDLLLITAVPSQGLDFTRHNQVYYDLADANDLPLLDLQDRLGTYAISNSLGLMSDAYHPKAEGYVDVARAVQQVIGL